MTKQQPNIFFTADTHFGHANIIKYCSRPYKTVYDMNVDLIDRWNSKVKKEDIVYHLGDFAFMQPDDIVSLRKQLNGTIHLIYGNHDKNVINTKGIFESIQPRKELYINCDDEKLYFVLDHYAMRVWNKSHHGAIHLYGHSHGTLVDDPSSRSMDVGVDTNNYFPYALSDVLLHMYKKVYKPVDHHD